MSNSPSRSQGLLDTSVVIDLHTTADALPDELAVSTVTLAELAAGVHTAHTSVERARRQMRLQWVEASFSPLPFDVDASRVFGALAGVVVASGRKPRKRFADLQIAAIAAAHRVALYTRNPEDFTHLHDFLSVEAV